MKNQFAQTVAAKAAAGLLAAVSACSGGTPKAASPEQPTGSDAPAPEAAEMGVPPTSTDGAQGSEAVTADAPESAAAGNKDCCSGKNDCKGKGGCKTDKNECKGKNDCKGKGGCNMHCPK